MNAGEINIKVTASMDDFNRAMSSVRKGAEAGGADGAKGFSSRFSAMLKDNFSDQKVGKLIGNMLGLGMVDGMMRSASDAIRQDKSLGEALDGVITGLPILGSAYDLGKAISQKLGMGVSDGDYMKNVRMQEGLAYEADMKAAFVAEEEKKKATKKRLEEQKKEAERIAKEAADRELAFQNVNSREELAATREREALKTRIAIDEATRRGDLEEALRLEMEKAVADERQRLMDDFGAGQLAASQEERDAFQRNLAERERLTRDEFDRRLFALRDEEAKKKEIADKADAERLSKFQDDLARQTQEMEDQRIQAAQAGVGSINTAIGSFKFDAYPAAEKRKNDQSIVRSLEAIREQQKSGGFV